MLSRHAAVLLAVCVGLSIRFTAAIFRCHNHCSGHGYCNAENVCVCEKGLYRGVDCSEYLCQQGFAWADKAYAVDSAHLMAECSNAGVCNRMNGKCKCAAGFTGAACERMTCGLAKCSGHGECMTMGQIYQQYSTVRSEINVYSPWEAEQTTACVCSIGYTGNSCEIKLCPKGDDPFTPHNAYRTITVDIKAQLWEPLALVSGHLLLEFNGESVQFSPDPTVATASYCKTQFESLRNVKAVDCSLAVRSTVHSTYTVKFKSFPLTPYENNIYNHRGNPPLSSFACGIALLNSTAVACTLADVTASNNLYPEYVPCSNRGNCDTTSGLCKCYFQLTNANCDTYKSKMPVNYIGQMSADVMQLEIKRLNYGESSVILSNADVNNVYFRIIKAANEAGDVFILDGLGNIVMSNGGMTIGRPDYLPAGRGLTIAAGGLRLTGGVTINSKGLVVTGEVNVRNGGATVASGGLIVEGGMTVLSGLRVAGGFTSAHALYIPTAGLNVGGGGGTIQTGGLMVTAGGVTVAGGGIWVDKSGVTINSGGMVVSEGMQTSGIRSGLLVTDGFSLGSGGLRVTGGMTSMSLKMTLTGGLTIAGSGLFLFSGSITMHDGGLSVTGGMSVATAGVGVTGGVTVKSLGMNVYSGGVRVTGGVSVSTLGLQVSGGTSISSSGMYVSGGLTVASSNVFVTGTQTSQVGNSGVTTATGVVVSTGGLVVTGGLTVYGADNCIVSGGVTVVNTGLLVTGGMTTHSHGVAVTGGVTLGSGPGLLVTGGSTIYQGGAYVLSGLTVSSSGMVVSNGLTISSAGLHIASGGISLTGQLGVTGGWTVNDIGLKVTDGLSIEAGGMIVSGGLTVNTRGMYIASGGLTIQSDGAKITGGISVESSGLQITGGLIISTGGLNSLSSLSVTGGMTVVDTGVTVLAAGMYAAAGITVSDLGVVITTHGISVSGGGLSVTGGVTVSTAGVVVVTSGATIAAEGINVISGGKTINTGGVVVSAGSVIIDWSGLYDADIFTIASEGIRIANGMTVFSGGIYYSGSSAVNIASSGADLTLSQSAVADKLVVTDSGLLVNDGGVAVAGGLYASEGVSATGNMVIASGGLVATGGVTTTAGLYVTGGVSVITSGANIDSGMTIVSNGLYVTAGSLSIATLGLRVSKGVTVASTGVQVTGGLSLFDSGAIVSGLSKVNAGGVKLLNALPMKSMDAGLFVSGGLTVNGASTFIGTVTPSLSDQRVKTNITTIANPLSKLHQLNGVYYNLKKNQSLPSSSSVEATGGDVHVGLIAQEVQLVLPEVVVDGGEFLSVKYADMVALLIEAVKELDELLTEDDRREEEEEDNDDEVEDSVPEVLLDRYFVSEELRRDVDSSVPYSDSSCSSCNSEEVLQRVEAMLLAVQSLEDEGDRLQAILDDLRGSTSI